jgi:hypothetical protein
MPTCNHSESEHNSPYKINWSYSNGLIKTPDFSQSAESMQRIEAMRESVSFPKKAFDSSLLDSFFFFFFFCIFDYGWEAGLNLKRSLNCSVNQ